MKQKYLLFKFFVVMLLMGFINSSVFGQAATLKHSYTFEDGTAKDVVGTANGTLVGGTITDGAYTASANGQYIELPAATIAINTYPSISVECYIKADVDVTWASMLAYFGETETGTGNNYGANYYFITPDRWTESRAAISCGNTTSPWGAEQGYTGSPVSVGNKHHVVSTLTNTSISLYIDGVLSGSAEVSGANSIAALSNSLAYICKGGYAGDPTWQGTVYEYNIYEGVLDETTINSHYTAFMGDDFFNAKLLSLTTNTSTLSPAFSPDVDVYEINVDYGITSLKLTATPEIDGATVKMFGLDAAEITDGVVTYKKADGGVDIEIIVTAVDKSTEKSYYVSVWAGAPEESANLDSIGISTGKLLNAFHPDTTKYSALVPYGTTSVDITGIPSATAATVTGGGSISLTNGVGSATLKVTSQDGSKTKEYKVDLYASKVGTGQFYYIQHEPSKFVVEESKAEYNTIRLGAPLKGEKGQLFQIIESGVAGQYFLKNQSNNYLSQGSATTWDLIMIDTITQDADSCRFILHEFEPGRFRIESVTKSASEQKFMGPNNNDYNGGVFSDKYLNNNLITWNILPADELVPFDTYLSDLSVSPGTFNPVFALYIKEYFVVLPAGTTSMTVNATARDAASTVSGSGAIDVSNGRGSVIVKVSATDPKYFTEYKINYFVDGPLKLEHSYTFASGTAQDVVGDADGTINGGSIKNGVYTASANGHHISFPAEKIAINTYPSITVETYLKNEVANDNNTMNTYFGNTTGTYGTSYFFTSLKSRAAVSCLNTGNPWSTESGYTGTNVLNDVLPHHLVSVMTYDSLILYLDGTEAGRVLLSDANKIFNLGTQYAYLCKSGYTGDKTWMGQVLEYNIYSGKMDAATVATRAANFPIEDSTSDATLSALLVNTDTVSDFVSYKLDYKVVLPAGTTGVPTVTGTPKYSNATVVVTPAASLSDTTEVTVTAFDGVTKLTYKVTFEVKEGDPTVNIEDSKLSTVKVYPTVFNENLKIVSDIDIDAVSIFDITGKMVYKYNVKTKALNVNANLNNGMYFVKVEIDGAFRTFKVFKSN